MSWIYNQKLPRAGLLASQLARIGEHKEGLLAQQAYKQLFDFVGGYFLSRAKPRLLGLPSEAGQHGSLIAQPLVKAATLTTEQFKGEASHA